VRTAYKRGDFALFNNASQAWNHEFYWHSLRPEGGGTPHGQVAKLVDRDVGGPEAFVDRLRVAATGHFGSGWAWVVVENDQLKITHTDSAISSLVYGQIPLLASYFVQPAS
jgi:Fe-Mn family superoxide dismutase